MGASSDAEKAKQQKGDSASQARRSVRRGYKVYRRAGLKPLCAIKYLIQHSLGNTGLVRFSLLPGTKLTWR